MTPHSPGRLAAIILAGGTAVRMDGVDKAAIELDGRTLLEHALDAVLDADEVVVVMPEAVPTSRPVTVVHEDPPHGGPAAGLLTGIDALLHRPATVLALAVDMPWVTTSTVRRLRRAAVGRDGAFLVDPHGRRQLAGVVDATRLAAVAPRPGERHALPMHGLLGALDLAGEPAEGREALDLDTWADVREGRG